MEVILLCRCGFEKEVASEINAHAAKLSIGGYIKTEANSGLVRFVTYQRNDAENLIQRTSFDELVFVRHWLVLDHEFTALDTQDRVTPILDVAGKLPKCSSLQCINVDTNEGKSLAKLTRGIGRHLETCLEKVDFWQTQSAWVLQLLCLAGDHVLIGRTSEGNMSPWLGGIPRLKVPRSAPSRATLKLEEAWLHFVPKEQREERLRPSMKAVDLGAAPGGWTWQLVNKSMFVDAVDNGPMDESLMDSGQVTHHLEDGFRYSPPKPVDWLVCDIADKPSRVASLIAHWAENRWFREAVFNLKLPMKQRYVAVEEARHRIASQLVDHGTYELKFKQLYHDREEVTGHIRLF